jgi:tripartite-type tricarboxylate transporter receptor subunit TctC
MQLGRRAALGGLAMAGVGATARAQAWPARTVTWIVPFAAGGVNDVFARPISAHVSQALGQSMVVDNRSGAGGTLGAAMAARAAPDGYTLLVGNTAHTYAPLIYPQAGFDLLRDFAPVSAFARVNQALVINPAVLPVTSLQEFIALARKKPDSIDIASAGLGTVPHLATELLEARLGIRLNHTPYRGSGPALLDLLSGTVGAIFNPVANLMGYVRTGKLRVLAVAGRRREPMLPDVPTMDEAGVADFRAIAWVGLFAPRATPAPVLDRLHGAVQAALEADDVKRIWADQGARVELESRSDFEGFVGREVERWSRITKATAIEMD